MGERAWQYRQYGGIDALELAPIARPRARGDDVVVRVAAAALNPKDALVRKGRFRLISGRRFPKLAGVDFAGVIVEAGPRSELPVGARVFGALDEFRFLRGSLATVVRARAAEVARLPDGLDFQAAASLPLAGLTALQALRDLARVGPGMRVVVNGGAGGVGTLAVQIAVALGADVTSVSGQRNLDLCRSLGATDALAHDGGGDVLGSGTWDVFFDVFGNKSLAAVRKHLTAKGVYISTVPSIATVVDALLTRFSDVRARLIRVRPSRSDLEELAALWAAGRLKAVIDRVVGMDDVPEAFRHLETKRARGKIVVQVAETVAGMESFCCKR